MVIYCKRKAADPAYPRGQLSRRVLRGGVHRNPARQLQGRGEGTGANHLLQMLSLLGEL